MSMPSGITREPMECIRAALSRVRLDPTTDPDAANHLALDSTCTRIEREAARWAARTEWDPEGDNLALVQQWARERCEAAWQRLGEDASAANAAEATVWQQACEALEHHDLIGGPLNVEHLASVRPMLLDPLWLGGARERLGLDGQVHHEDLLPAAYQLDDALAFTDVGHARRIWELCGSEVRWVRDVKSWAVYRYGAWEMGQDERVIAMAELVAEALALESMELERQAAAVDPEDPRAKWLSSRAKAAMGAAKRAASATGINAALSLLKAQPGIALSMPDFDSASSVMLCGRRWVDLQGAGDRRARRSDLFTRRAPAMAEPGVDCPAWRAWLADVLGSEEMAEWAQLAIGYSLTGSCVEQCLFLLTGTGSNGKSTFFRVLAQVLGDYAGPTPRTLLLAEEQGRDRHPAELAALRGLRVAYAPEVPQDRRMDEEKVKVLTGGDSISARYMGGNWFDFEPQHVLWLGVNKLPRVYGTDHAIWRRIRVVPFEQTYWRMADPRRPADGRLVDPTMEARLLEEVPAIVRWAVEGARMWHRRRATGMEGVPVPRAIADATAAYRLGEDRVAAWVEECCIVAAKERAESSVLYRHYSEWVGGHGERPESMRTWGQRMTDGGYDTQKANAVNWRVGLRLAHEHERRAELTGVNPRRGLKPVPAGDEWDSVP